MDRRFLRQADFLERTATDGAQEPDPGEPRLQQFSVRKATSVFMRCMLAL
jgi:hypothetical protein